MNSNPDCEKTNPSPPPRKSPVRYTIAILFAAIYWPAWVVMIVILALATMPFMKRQAHERLGQRILAAGFLSFMNVLTWLNIVRIHDDDLKRHAYTPGPLIIASNHPALWDALLIIRRFVWVSCIMKRELTTNPLLCTGASFAGFIPNTPRLEMIRYATRHLRGGGRLLFFPEGTRTRRESKAINPFRPGLALLAKQSAAPVLPIFITSDSHYLEKGWPIWRMPPIPITISLKVGEQVTIQANETVREFSTRLEDVFKVSSHHHRTKLFLETRAVRAEAAARWITSSYAVHASII